MPALGDPNTDNDWTQLSTLPIKKMILYQHGIGFIERRAVFTSRDPLQLRFDEGEMNDILKSLCIFDTGLGKVTGVSFETSDDQAEALKQTAFRIDPENAVEGLFQAVRGYLVTLTVLNGETLTGKIIGADTGVGDAIAETVEASTDTKTDADRENHYPQPKVVLMDDDAVLHHIPLDRILSLKLEDPYAKSDLDYFLDSAQSLRRQASKSMTVFLEGDQHDLTIGYLTTMPAWRVSYRVLYSAGKAQLQGWGIVENQLDEDLENVDLTLISGMPISFVYDIYAPSSVKRPYVQEERAGMKIPVSFEQDTRFTYDSEIIESTPTPPPVTTAPSTPKKAEEEEEEEEVYKLTAGSELTTTVDSSQVDLGEQFSYHIQNPISIRRGQSALVPLFMAEIECAKEHVYNKETTGENPLVCMLIKNSLGMILDRGPITVFDEDLYAGEAILPFTTYDAENRIAYATDLAVECSEKIKNDDEYKSFGRDKEYLTIEQYEIERYEYAVENRKAQPITVIIEHPTSKTHTVYDTPDILEETESYQRWRFAVEPQTRTVFTVNQRRLLTPREEIKRLSPKQLAEYKASGKMDDELYEFCRQILELQAKIDTNTQFNGKLETHCTILKREIDRLDAIFSRLLDPDQRRLLEKRSRKQPLDGDELVAFGALAHLHPHEARLFANYNKALVEHRKRLAKREDCRDFLNQMNSYLNGLIRSKLRPSYYGVPSEPSEDLSATIEVLLKEPLTEFLINPLTPNAPAVSGGDLDG